MKALVSYKRTFLFLAAIFLSNSFFSQGVQKKYKSRNYKKEAVWILMMDDPQANYFETIKAFRDYYASRKLPKEPFENQEMDSFEKEIGLITDKKSEEKRERRLKKAGSKKTEQDYSAEVRAFKGWMQNIKPWVRVDGSIVSFAEQQEILNQQQQELKELELKNGKK